jgi:hypothetical protein
MNPVTGQQIDFVTYLKNIANRQPNPALIQPIVRTSTTRPQVIKPEPKAKDNPAIIAQLRKAAESLQSQIDQKFNPTIATQRVTARRARIADGMAADGRRLQQIQAKLYALADTHEAGIISPLLAGIKYRGQVETLLDNREYPDGQWSADSRKKLSQLGITPVNFDEVKQAFNGLGELAQADPIQARIKKLERDLLTYKIPGFFPTPKAICDKMIDLARIEPNDTILEPGAGKGNIAEAIRQQYPDNPLFVIEFQTRLSEILTLKGFEVIGADFLDCGHKFNCIIMNPPFEKFQDIDHVLHAFSLLRPGGRLVSIMGESSFFRTDRKAVDFREWLSMVGYDEKLPNNSFFESGTGVAARIVVIRKIGRGKYNG